jgi:cytochrome b6-f complex iron-sulfur subunit
MTLEEKINRNEFLKKMGFKGASLLAVYGLGSACASTDVTASLLTLNLTDAANSKLLTAGGYIIKNNVIVAKNKAGNYIATSLICSHEDLKEMTFRNEEWYCTAHAGRFAQNGSGLNKEGNKGTPVYKTTLVGDVLTITKA